MGDRLERFAAGSIVAIAAALAASWLLAITHALTRRNLAIALLLLPLAAIPFLRRPRRLAKGFPPLPYVLAAVLIGGWTLFILWRGAILPPLSHDAMTYHLPKAALLVQHHGYTDFASPDRRLRSFPANYELLVADVILLTGSDQLTEWIGTAFYLLFLALTALVARRWWGPGLHVVASVLGAASAPLLLLHSGADKNDLMAATFAVGALFWSARWCAEGGARAAALAIICGVAAIGTKMPAAAIVFGVAPFGVAALIRRPPRVRPLLATIAFACAAFLLLGGWVFITNATATTTVTVSATPARAVAGLPTASYGAWQNLIELPYEIVRVSLGLGVSRPWPKHDLFFSHFGALFGIALLALPFYVWRYRSDRERTVASLAALIAFVILLPIAQESRDLYAAILRYSMFVLPFVLAWTVAPVVRELAQRRPRYAQAALALLALTFVAQAIDIGVNDTFASIETLRTRQSNIARTRAAFVANRLAGPRDTIAVYGGSDVWIYPAFGERLTRRVVHLPYDDATPRNVPHDARWIAIDFAPRIGERPDARQLRLFDELARDGRFVLRWRQKGLNQAVFQRVAK